MSSPAATPHSVPFVIRYRGRWWGSALAVVMAAGSIVLAANTPWLGRYPYFPAGQSPWGWILGLGILAVGLTLVRCSVRVDKDGVVVTNVLRHHRIAWHDLQGVEVGNHPGDDDSPPTSILRFDRGSGRNSILAWATHRKGENNPELTSLAAQLLALKAQAVRAPFPVQDSDASPQDRPVTDFAAPRPNTDRWASLSESSAGSIADVASNPALRRRPVAILGGVAFLLLILGAAFFVTSRDPAPASIDAADSKIVYPASEESTPPAPPVELPPPLDLTGQLTGVWRANYLTTTQQQLLIFHPDGTMRIAVTSTELTKTPGSPAGSATYKVDGQSVTMTFPPSASSSGCTVVYRLHFAGEGTWNVQVPTSVDPACDQSHPNLAWYYSWTRISPTSPAGAIFNMSTAGPGVPITDLAPVAGTWLLPNTGSILLLEAAGSSVTYRIDDAGRIDTAPADHGTAAITADGQITLKSVDPDNIPQGCTDTILTRGTLHDRTLTIDVAADPCHRFHEDGHLSWGRLQ